VGAHAACSSLTLRECPSALVCGVNLLLTPFISGVFSRAGMLSAEGRCKTLDASADGYVRGEACRVLLVGCAEDAQQQPRVLIRGSAVNQDGRSSSLTAPNGPAQQEVMRAAARSRAAAVAMHGVHILEMHGTGTSLGDPIEVGAAAAVQLSGRRSAPLVLQSSKSCIGHCEPAAGAAGLVQLVLGLQLMRPTPLLHLRRPNPHADALT
jgi:acyl transferase domain-containing protein